MRPIKIINIIFVILTSLSVSSVFCQNYSYYIDGKLISYTVSADKMAVQLKENYNPNEWEKRVSVQKDVLSINQLKVLDGFFILKFNGLNSEDIETKISNFQKDEKISYVSEDEVSPNTIKN